MRCLIFNKVMLIIIQKHFYNNWETQKKICISQYSLTFTGFLINLF